MLQAPQPHIKQPPQRKTQRPAACKGAPERHSSIDMHMQRALRPPPSPPPVLRSIRAGPAVCKQGSSRSSQDDGRRQRWRARASVGALGPHSSVGMRMPRAQPLNDRKPPPLARFAPPAHMSAALGQVPIVMVARAMRAKGMAHKGECGRVRTAFERRCAHTVCSEAHPAEKAESTHKLSQRLVPAATVASRLLKAACCKAA